MRYIGQSAALLSIRALTSVLPFSWLAPTSDRDEARMTPRPHPTTDLPQPRAPHWLLHLDYGLLHPPMIQQPPVISHHPQNLIHHMPPGANPRNSVVKCRHQAPNRHPLRSFPPRPLPLLTHLDMGAYTLLLCLQLETHIHHESQPLLSTCGPSSQRVM
jgi:hypothetical protein